MTTSSVLFSNLIRRQADDIRANIEEGTRMVVINRFDLKELLGYIAVRQNMTMLEMEGDMDVSKRTLSKLTSPSQDIYISMQTSTIRRILDYVYETAERNEQMNQ